MPNRPRITDLTEFERLHNDGWTLDKLAEHYGCNRATIHRTRTRLGLPQRRPRLDNERRARIQERLNDGWSHAEIARTENVDPETIRRHFPGTGWDKGERIRHAVTASYYARKERRSHDPRLRLQRHPARRTRPLGT